VKRAIDSPERLRYYLRPQAEVAELADAQDSKSCAPCGHGGSTPPFGTMRTSDLHPIPNRQQSSKQGPLSLNYWGGDGSGVISLSRNILRCKQRRQIELHDYFPITPAVTARNNPTPLNNITFKTCCIFKHAPEVGFCKPAISHALQNMGTQFQLPRNFHKPLTYTEIVTTSDIRQCRSHDDS
jgi:hypothetical protein